MRVLIVDNFAGVSETLKLALEDYCRAAVTEAATSAIAARALQQPLDLAVIDTALPGISSFELSERAAKSNVPVLLISGDPEGQQICQTNDYPWLAKPFPLATLATAALEITRASSENIARLHQAYSRLRANLERSERAMAEAGRIVKESQRLMSLTTAARVR